MHLERLGHLGVNVTSLSCEISMILIQFSSFERSIFEFSFNLDSQGKVRSMSALDPKFLETIPQYVINGLDTLVPQC